MGALIMIRTYSELIRLTTFNERFRYLQLKGHVGMETFGIDRYINQRFYKSVEWKRVRDFVIVRDNGYDLGIDGHKIHGRIIIHHMNPMSMNDIKYSMDSLLEPEFLITTIHSTHNAIHYGDEKLLVIGPIERSRNDTCPWKT